MKNLLCLTVLLSTAFFPNLAQAAEDLEDDLLSVSPAVLTQRLMTDPAKREKALAGDAKAAEADAKLREITNGDPKKVEAMYQMASQIFGEMAAKHVADPDGGDKAMEKIMADAQRDPAAFMKTLSPEQQAQIEAMAAKK